MTTVIIRKDGKDIDLKLKSFENEQDLERWLLTNLSSIIPVKDISEENVEKLHGGRNFL
ncbi:MAG: hypothetical protein FGF48_07345 [Candidatus Brockarchaeota archaeon]|nr:hypothetical protein [Candidatus Brockarchaeota archaeon]